MRWVAKVRSDMIGSAAIALRGFAWIPIPRFPSLRLCVSAVNFHHSQTCLQTHAGNGCPTSLIHPGKPRAQTSPWPPGDDNPRPFSRPESSGCFSSGKIFPCTLIAFRASGCGSGPVIVSSSSSSIALTRAANWRATPADSKCSTESAHASAFSARCRNGPTAPANAWRNSRRASCCSRVMGGAGYAAGGVGSSGFKSSSD